MSENAFYSAIWTRPNLLVPGSAAESVYLDLNDGETVVTVSAPVSVLRLARPSPISLPSLFLLFAFSIFLATQFGGIRRTVASHNR